MCGILQGCTVLEGKRSADRDVDPCGRKRSADRDADPWKEASIGIKSRSRQVTAALAGMYVPGRKTRPQ